MRDKYYDIDRCSNSELGKIKRDLLGRSEFFAAPETLFFGEQFHKALFEPKKYDPESLSREKQNLLAAMVAACRRSSSINYFLENKASVFEAVKLFDFEGVKFKMKSDAKLYTWGADLKSTSSASLEAFVKTFDDYGYWRQAALYMVGAGLNKFTFWGVQKKISNPGIFIVNATDYPKKLEEALEEAKVLTLHYAKRKANGR